MAEWECGIQARTRLHYVASTCLGFF